MKYCSNYVRINNIAISVDGEEPTFGYPINLVSPYHDSDQTDEFRLYVHNALECQRLDKHLVEDMAMDPEFWRIISKDLLDSLGDLDLGVMFSVEEDDRNDGYARYKVLVTTPEKLKVTFEFQAVPMLSNVDEIEYFEELFRNLYKIMDENCATEYIKQFVDILGVVQEGLAYNVGLGNLEKIDIAALQAAMDDLMDSIEH